MASVIAAEPGLEIPDEVLDFARRRQFHGLETVIRAARTAFGGAAPSVSLEADPELEGEVRIIIQVGTNGLTAKQLADSEDHFDELCSASRSAGIVCLRLSPNA